MASSIEATPTLSIASGGIVRLVSALHHALISRILCFYYLFVLFTVFLHTSLESVLKYSTHMYARGFQTRQVSAQFSTSIYRMCRYPTLPLSLWSEQSVRWT